MNTAAQKSVEQAPAKELSYSERFTNMVVQQFSSLSPGSQVSEFQKRLAQNYFIKLDGILKELEKKRMGKPEEKREAIPYTWAKINTLKFALDVVAFTMVGLDPMQPNHINLIPYANNVTGVYDIGCMPGFRGLELKSKKYGFEVPDEIIIEVVYSTDNFKQYKKSRENAIESYDFEVTNDFNRGEIVGGFYYKKWNANPYKNTIKVFSLADIEKRKPKYASAEFWGGMKDVWENGKKKQVQIDGWKDEMVYKTIARAAYNSITIDSEKIDEAYQRLIMSEQEVRDAAVDAEVIENANKTAIGFEDIQHTQIEANPVPVYIPDMNESNTQETARGEEHKSPTDTDTKAPF